MLAPEIRHPRLVATSSEESKHNAHLVEEVAEWSVEHFCQNWLCCFYSEPDLVAVNIDPTSSSAVATDAEVAVDIWIGSSTGNCCYRLRVRLLLKIVCDHRILLVYIDCCCSLCSLCSSDTLFHQYSRCTDWVCTSSILWPPWSL